jgi:thymidine phosphorylase
MPTAPLVEEVRAESDGFITRLDAMGAGMAAWRLGAGRARKDEVLDLSAGVFLHKTLGEEVRKGDVIMTLHAESADRMPRGLAALSEACEGAGTVDIGDAPVDRHIILDRIGSSAGTGTGDAPEAGR